jgi:hypothetical protein
MPKLVGLRAMQDLEALALVRAHGVGDELRFFITDRGRAWLSE